MSFYQLDKKKRVAIISTYKRFLTLACITQQYLPIYSELTLSIEPIFDVLLCIVQVPSPGDNTTRLVIQTSKYIQVVIYDHMTRRKAYWGIKKNVLQLKLPIYVAVDNICSFCGISFLHFFFLFFSFFPSSPFLLWSIVYHWQDRRHPIHSIILFLASSCIFCFCLILFCLFVFGIF